MFYIQIPHGTKILSVMKVLQLKLSLKISQHNSGLIKVASSVNVGSLP